MLYIKALKTPPTEYEGERASNSYLISLIAMFAGLPLPIMNLIATIIFYIGNRKSTYFVRWHCTQALISQFTLFIFNSLAFWWTLYTIISDQRPGVFFIIYLIIIVLINLLELIMTIITSIHTRKGHHVEWFFYRHIADRLCRE